MNEVITQGIVTSIRMVANSTIVQIKATNELLDVRFTGKRQEYLNNYKVGAPICILGKLNAVITYEKNGKKSHIVAKENIIEAVSAREPYDSLFKGILKHSINAFCLSECNVITTWVDNKGTKLLVELSDTNLKGKQITRRIILTSEKTERIKKGKHHFLGQVKQVGNGLVFYINEII